MNNFKLKFWPILLLALLISSCNFQKNKVSNNIAKQTLSSVSVSSVEIVNNQLVITGRNFDNVKKVKVEGPYLNENFTIESISSSRIVANAMKAVEIGVNGVFGMHGIFNLILSNADAAATVAVSFTLQDRSVTANKLSSMGAQIGQVLKFNGTTWIPSNLSSSQLYLGTYDAAANVPNLASTVPNAGDYYIVTAEGTYNSITYPVNSWIMYNGTDWEKISNGESIVSSFKGRRGVVVPLKGDYSLGQMSNVDFVTVPPLANHILQYNGANWVPGIISPFAQTALPTCGAGQVLKSDGTNFSCVTDNSGAGAFLGTPDRVVSTDGSGVLTSSAITVTELSYVSGVTSSIQAQLNNKQALDSTLTSLAAYNTNGIMVQTAGDTFVGRSLTGTTNRMTVTNGDGVAGNPTINLDTTLFPSPTGGDSGKILKATAADTSAWSTLSSSDITTALGFTPIDQAGDTISVGTFTFDTVAVVNVPDPTPPYSTSAANAQWVTAQITGNGVWNKSGSDINYNTGKVGIGTMAPSSLLSVTPTQYNTGTASQSTATVTGTGTAWTSAMVGSQFVFANGVSAGTITAVTDATTLSVSTSQTIADQAYKIGYTGLQVAANGNVGIGTTNPTSTIAVIPGDLANSRHTVGQFSYQQGGGASAGVHLGYYADGVSATKAFIYSDGASKDLGFESFYGGSVQTNMLIKGSNGNIGIGTPTPSVSLDLGSKTDAIRLPAGTTAQEPATPLAGMFRYNTENNLVEFYNGTSWLSLTTGTNGNYVMSTAGSVSGGLTVSNAIGTGLTVVNGSSISGGLNNNSGGITSAGAITGATTVAASTSITSPIVYGNSTASANLVLDSTSDATKGYVLLAPSGGNVGIGTNSPKDQLQLGNRTTFHDAGASWSMWQNNAYFDGNDYRNIATGGGANILLNGTGIGFRSIASGAADAVATITDTMFIKNNGNVGIGTTEPNQGKLVVQNSDASTTIATQVPGSIAIRNTDATNGNFSLITFNDGLAGTATAGIGTWNTTHSATSTVALGDLALFTKASGVSTLSERMRITSTGNVGIGTTGPSLPLTVQTASPGGLFGYQRSDASLMYGMYYGNYNGNTSPYAMNYRSFIGSGPATTNPAFVFYTDNVGSAGTVDAAMSILSNGNVGIGATNPASKLQVTDTNNSSAYSMIVDNLATGRTSGTIMTIDADSADNSGYNLFRVSNNNTSSPKFLVRGDGNVGIGTTTPAGLLELYKSQPYLRMNDTQASGKIVDLMNGYPGPGKFSFWTNDTPGYILTMATSTGNVGIGNTAPGKLLHVGSATVGTGVAVANFQNADGTCTITPAAAGSGIACSSDERLKENFQDVQGVDVLDRILKLQAVTYNFKTASTETRRTGYKAQEVQKVAPEFVRQDDNGFFQVYYDGLIPWITEAIKTLYNRIMGAEAHQGIQDRAIASVNAKTAKLEAENAAKDQKIKKLEQENALIKARLDKIEKALNSK